MNVNDLILRATQAANTAGDEWMKNAKVRFAVMDGEQVVGQLLDVCGNAHVRFTDKRTKEYKAFKNAGHTSITDVLYTFLTNTNTVKNTACTWHASKRRSRFFVKKA